MKLQKDFYIREDVVLIAKELLGKVLITNFNGAISAGIITETEAYAGINDRASHAFGGRRTARTETMYATGGTAYVYLCYGIHHLFNVVTATQDTAHAVLIRALEPLEGVEWMLERRKMKNPNHPALTTGPGALAQALGLTTRWTGQNMLLPDSPVWIEDRGIEVAPSFIVAGKRIGVDYAGECAEWPWRFWLQGSKYHK